MKPFEGKSILVTGASSGIGLAVSRKVMEEGGAVFAISRNPDRLKAAFSSGGRAIQYPMDVTRFEDYRALEKEVPLLAGAVFAAGNSPLIPVRNIRLTDLEQTMRTHLYHPILMTMGLLKARKLDAGASIVLVSSKAALAPGMGQMPYALAKTALSLAARCMTAELTRKTKIRFNAVLPGLVETGLMSEALRMVGEDRLQAMIDEYPLGIGQPTDVASLIVFLLSEASRWISGSSLVIDGGVR